jgi:hypothetical protein
MRKHRLGSAAAKYVGGDVPMSGLIPSARLSREERKKSRLAEDRIAFSHFLVHRARRPPTTLSLTRATCWIASKQKLRSWSRHNANNVFRRHIRHLDPCRGNNTKLPRNWRPFEDPRIRSWLLCLSSGRVLLKWVKRHRSERFTFIRRRYVSIYLNYFVFWDVTQRILVWHWRFGTDTSTRNVGAKPTYAAYPGRWKNSGKPQRRSKISQCLPSSTNHWTEINRFRCTATLQCRLSVQFFVR